METVVEEGSPKTPKLCESMEWCVVQVFLQSIFFSESEKWIFKIEPAGRRVPVARPHGPTWIEIDENGFVSWPLKLLTWQRTVFYNPSFTILVSRWNFHLFRFKSAKTFFEHLHRTRISWRTIWEVMSVSSVWRYTTTKDPTWPIRRWAKHYIMHWFYAIYAYD